MTWPWRKHRVDPDYFKRNYETFNEEYLRVKKENEELKERLRLLE